MLDQYGGPEVLTLKDIPSPRCGPGQVRVKVAATALNRADVLQRLGRYPAPGPRPAYEIPGLEFAGVVEHVGDGVETVRVGDRVMGLLASGGYAEEVVTLERMVIPVPDNLSFEEAAAIPEAFFTAYDALIRLKVQIGTTVLIHAAASGVGSTAVQLAKAMGASVIGTCGSQEKVNAVRQLGADLVINYHDADFLEQAREFTAGRGVDAICDFVGAIYFERNLAALAPLGRIIFIGTVGGAEASLNIGLVLNRRLELIGTALRSRPIEEKLALTDAIRRQVMPLVAKGRVRPVIDRIYPIQAVAEAHRRMEANQNIGKIVLKVS